MRHRRKGRVLGRSPSHRKAMFKNLASSLFLTERDAELDDNAPKVKGRVVTTLEKAKEIRPLVERCITIAKRSLAAEEESQKYATDAERGSDAWKTWRKSENWRKWTDARAPAIAARRRVLQLLGDKQAMHIVFDELADRFRDRPGGYTRILRLAKPRLGDAGTRAILEFVGVNDRVSQKAERPSFDDDSDAAEEEVASEESKASDE
ncbi:50S ribosomal protein L17 [Rosistilla carotiformis]|uniref:Large ribosomal subunit protein bL17 n=1 Tax=Rosistilla carotiformis TaxID=2528017 RepID=A0A518JYF4_9BACT|nr:L17 family ribosomal protein [Rosistilla carotiformis]QDV70574.1 50S ribosomal protein L17 [Rosistilla carotiformis]